MVDIAEYRSHHDKTLFEHTEGVLRGVRARTNLDIAELAAIFHDVGKLNPNFQKKLDPDFVSRLGNSLGSDYSNHSYLSALAFLCYCQSNPSILERFKKQREWLASILAMISHHHGDLPDLPDILRERETNEMLSFIRYLPFMPASDFISRWIRHTSFSMLNRSDTEFLGRKMQIRLAKGFTEPLKFYLDTQFAFACLIAADKTDAANYTDLQAERAEALSQFCSAYSTNLGQYLDDLTEGGGHVGINKLRTEMRLVAQSSLRQELESGKRVFSLTAPTGAGKTLMLLALAGEIIDWHGPRRLVYTLPFLSITEQVEKECLRIFQAYSQHIQRIDSKADNSRFDDLQNRAESEPEAARELFAEQFAEHTFDYPFIISTFVRFFETLVSNRNATLLKLPNFSDAIFLIDEIQALPPRLYGFFVALLDVFCCERNSFAVISTATMPEFELPVENQRHDLQAFFPGYVSAREAELMPKDYFRHQLFNRYTVESIKATISVEDLADMLRAETQSVLVILNTIDDTKDLFSLFEGSDAEVVMLNTHFTPSDRQQKIRNCRRHLLEGRRVVLVSTQLIEAGVDIDFPVVYRDICPIPSIVQSAGRCNRNGRLEKGKVVVFQLVKDGRQRARAIYRGRDEIFLSFVTEKVLGNSFEEPDLLDLQEEFFRDRIQRQTQFGVHFSTRYNGGQEQQGSLDFVQRIKEAAFQSVGKFRLIDEAVFGVECQYYVPRDPSDDAFAILENLYEAVKSAPVGDHAIRRLTGLRLQDHIRKMSNRVVQVRLKDESQGPQVMGGPCCGIYEIETSYYTFTHGVRIGAPAIL